MDSGRKSRVLIEASDAVELNGVADGALYQSFRAKRNLSVERIELNHVWRCENIYFITL